MIIYILALSRLARVIFSCQMLSNIADRNAMNSGDVILYVREACLLAYFSLSVPKHCVLLDVPLVNSPVCWALCWLLGIVQHPVNQVLFAGWSQQRNVRLSFNISMANISRLHLEYPVSHLYHIMFSISFENKVYSVWCLGWKGQEQQKG